MPPGKKTQHHSRAVFAMKVAHRLTLLPPAAKKGQPPVRVLDAYAGDHDIWNAVALWRPDVRVVHIERDPRPRYPLDLRGDNMKYLLGLDLTRFAAIDLDAWGVPGHQLKAVADRGFEGPVWWTYIPKGMSQVDNAVMAGAGIPPEWGRVAPALCRGNGWESWLRFLGSCGYPAVMFARHAPYSYGAVGAGVDTFDLGRFAEHLATVTASPVGR